MELDLEKLDGVLHKKKIAFLRAYIEWGTISGAAKAIGISRMTHWNWCDSDEKFKEAFETAKQVAVGSLEDEAMRRAVQGVRRPRFHQGQPVMVPLMQNGQPVLEENEEGEMVPVLVPYMEHEYSDTLLIFLLKANAPEKYRERYEARPDVGTIEIIMPDGGPMGGRAKVREIESRDDSNGDDD